MKHVTILYFGYLRERAGTSEEQVQTHAHSIIELFNERAATLGLNCSATALRFARNECFCPPTEVIAQADTIAFMPPLSGG